MRIATRRFRFHHGIPLAAAALITLSAPAPARGQYAIDRQMNPQVQQDGHMLDANPALYGGRFNAPRPATPLLGSDPYATGLARRGFSLQIQSPIPAGSSFRGHLGSGDLYDFRRDAVSAGDSPLGTVSLSEPYYDPSRTVTSLGFLRDLEATTPGLRPTARPRVPDNALFNLKSEFVGLLPLPNPEPATESGIFGVPPVPRVNLPTNEPVLPWQRSQEKQERPTDSERPYRLEPRTEPPKSPDVNAVLSTPLDAVLAAELGPNRHNLPSATPGVIDARVLPPAPGVILPSQTVQAAVPAPLQFHDATMLPGYDLFNDLQIALAYRANPQSEWFQTMIDAERQQPALAKELPEEAVRDAPAYVERILREPLKSFIGGGASALNSEMLKAESLMAIGHYREAADQYEIAAILAPTNPLPQLGRGHALLAAGEYRSAAQALLRGLARYPELTHFAIDLKALLGGGEIIDIRRADILRRLEQREVPELRFLLGYLEYHAGDHERGLADLEQAARSPTATPFIARYPDFLKGKATLPPPKLLPEIESHPADATPPEAPSVPGR